MIHKFVANDNKGNVNILEVTSTGTKLGKVAPPVEDTDVATKKYVDDNAAQANDVVLNATVAYDDSNQNYDIVITSALPSASDLESYFNDNRSIVLHFTNVTWDARLQLELKEVDTATGTYYSFIGEGVGFDGDKLKYVFRFDVDNAEYVSYVGKVYIGDKCIVTLTPTSPDFSGTMDKTVEEITAAYEAGQEIVFRFMTTGTTYYDIIVTNIEKASDDYPSFSGFGLLTERLVQVYTHSTMDGTDNTYGTAVYSLTPAS